MVPPLTQSKALPPRDWVTRLLCPSPSSYFRLSHLVVLGFLPASCAISTQPGCSLPQAPMGPAWRPCSGGVWGRGAKLPSLSVCLGPPCCLDGAAPPPCLWGTFVFFCCFFILMRLAQSLPPPPPRSSPRTAVNLSVVINTAALLPASAFAVSLIKCGDSSLPLTRLVLWEDSGGTGGWRLGT